MFRLSFVFYTLVFFHCIYAQNIIHLDLIPAKTAYSSDIIDLRVNTLTVTPGNTLDDRASLHLTIDFSKMDLEKDYCVLDTQTLSTYADYPAPKIRNPLMSSWTIKQNPEIDYFYAQAKTFVFDAYHMQKNRPLTLRRISELPVFQFYYNPDQKCWEGDFFRTSIEWDEGMHAYWINIYNFQTKKKRLKRSSTAIALTLTAQED
ncbi:MAG TPA: hypothetical protein PKC21_09335 [Oligoflexia bacterium]|nr:hypothetical protein [Oligoflexia bacterium]HMR25540.1 hypothetical protein [Oligoflexia bacterium]